ncbi:MAG: GTP cyclohydrolase I FolE [Pseudomonadota bacterium]|nr:GTP cyclohydrolase I FolE [Pseudomonadota bacterium]
MTETHEFNTLEILKNVRPTPLVNNGLSRSEKIKQITAHFRGIMETLGLDLMNDSLARSPERVAEMYVDELFAGLTAEYFPKITVHDNDYKYDQMIVVKDVSIMSVCEHHFVTIDGLATIAYTPKDKVIGLSKINRIASYFSKRPQVQERLTKQIADCLEYVLETPNVAVHIIAKHYCVVSRGVKDINSLAATTDLRGDFKKNPETRTEFLNACRSKMLS